VEFDGKGFMVHLGFSITVEPDFGIGDFWGAFSKAAMDEARGFIMVATGLVFV
jgi:hypothetical protein